MNSFNHYAYGACNEWLYRTVLGIDAAEPGFTTISLAPQPGGGLTWARGHYECLHGTIASAWSLADGSFTWDVSVPPNTTAIAQLPGTDAMTISESGKPLSQARGVLVTSAAREPVRLRLGSGSYHFVVPKP